jgi:hypothetical protein
MTNAGMSALIAAGFPTAALIVGLPLVASTAFLALLPFDVAAINDL